MSLINKILRDSQVRLRARASVCPESELMRMMRDAPQVRSLSAALRVSGRSVIAEHKRRSPSGGSMDAANLARAFQTYAGTPWISAISVLTDEDHFDGSLADLKAARERCGSKPILRKDFIVDRYQVLEARAYGADAILLMTTLHAHDAKRFRELFDLATELGMDALIELGMSGGDTEALARIVPEAAPIWGINSRKFEGRRASLLSAVAKAVPGLNRFVSRVAGDMTTALGRHRELRGLIPAGKLGVAESGIGSAQDLRDAFAMGYDAALIGTAFVKGPKPIEQVVRALAPAFETSGEPAHPDSTATTPSTVASHYG